MELPWPAPEPVVPGKLLSIAVMVLIAVASAPLLAVSPFTALVFVAIVVVVSCAVTVQAMRAARRMYEYRILSSAGSVSEIYEWCLKSWKGEI